MFTQILASQWKWTRLIIVAATLLAFAMPMLSVRNVDLMGSWAEAQSLLGSMQVWGIFYAMLSALLGLLVGTTAWTPDHRGRHVYALTLPVARWHYVLMRLGAGVVLLTAPFVAVWVGGMLAAASIAIPPGLHAYPGALAMRFGLSSLVAFAVFFSIASGTTRTAGFVIGALGVLVVGDLFGEMLNKDLNLLQNVVLFLFPSPGVFEVFTGRWMLIDV